MTNRPAPYYTGSIWACPTCRTAWQHCDCEVKCRAPSASTPARTGRGVALSARPVRR